MRPWKRGGKGRLYYSREDKKTTATSKFENPRETHSCNGRAHTVVLRLPPSAVLRRTADHLELSFTLALLSRKIGLLLLELLVLSSELRAQSPRERE